MADAFEDEMEQTISLKEYAEGLKQQELEAEVLGGDDGVECTYSNGYMKRQAIFSCLTCVPAGNAGVCTACSLSCHDGHEVVELLWTKRKIKCDCGNSKFGEFYCKLCPNKDPENTDNSYNQNFKGSYCTCGRPYPDPQAEEQVEMMQCCICEDWFHENHLGLDSSEEIPNDEVEHLFDDFICQDCALTCKFLTLYPATIWATSKEKNVPLKSSVEENVLEHGSSAGTYPEKNENGIPVSASLVKCSSTHLESKTVSNEDDSFHGENTSKELGLEKAKACCYDVSSSSTCILGVDINATSLVLEEKKPMFLSKKWRDLLCRCITCSEFYTKMGIDYLIEKEDSFEEYEKMAEQKREERLQQQEGAELNFLNGLGHIQKIEILGGMNDMKNELLSFLDSWDESKAITPAEVQGIFENLAKKRRRLL